MNLRLIRAALSLVMFTSLCAAQTTLYVDDDAPGDPGPGDVGSSDPLEDGSSGHPFDAIQEAIDAAVAGDTVLVRDGLYSGNGNVALNFGGKDLTVRGQNGAAFTTLDGGSADRLFVFENGETSASLVEGLTLTGGDARSPLLCGGAVYCVGASPRFEDCIIRNNENGGTSDFSCHGGAGVYLFNSASVFSGCRFIENLGKREGDEFLEFNASGGAIYAEQSTLTLLDCDFVGNRTGERGTDGIGGAVALQTCTATIARCTFTDNLGGDGGWRWPGNSAIANGDGASGGAIGAVDSDLLVEDCAFSGNQGGEGANGDEDLDGRDGGDGGAIYLDNTTATIRRCAFRQNRTGRGGRAGLFFGDGGDGGDGGALYAGAGSQVTLVNVLLAGNLARIEGEARQSLPGMPGVAGAVAADGATTVEMINATLVDNRAPSDLPGADVFRVDSLASISVVNAIVRGPFDLLSDGGGSLTMTYSNVEGGFAGTGNFDGDPAFRDADGVDDDPATHGDNDFHPVYGASGNDAGNNLALPAGTTLDIEGGARLVDDPNAADAGAGTAPFVDLGAYETNNGLPNDCDLPWDPNQDCNGNGIKDGCDALVADCNGNGIPDDCDLSAGTSLDCNGNGQPDECETEMNDCNNNGIPDDCDVALLDCNGNGIPDDCDAVDNDCNGNGVPDECDVTSGVSSDCNQDGISDDCQVRSPLGGYGLQFDGAARLDFPGGAVYRIMSGPVTIEARVHLADVSGSQTIVRKHGNNYWLRVVDGAILFGFRSNNPYSYETGPVVTAETWEHIAVVYQFGTDTISVYLNGQVVPGTWTAPPAGNPATNNQPLYIGNNDNQVSGLNGIVDEVRVWNVARTQGEIQGAAAELIDPATPGLVAYCRFDEGSGANTREEIQPFGGLLPSGADWVVLVDCSCADTNGDGVVDLADLAVILSNFGGSGALADGDVTGDGTIDLFDLARVLAEFGTTCAP